MGNRAVITTKENWKHNGVGIYLHWNGVRDSVEAFLKYCNLKGYRSPSEDCYGWARLAQVIGNMNAYGDSIEAQLANRNNVLWGKRYKAIKGGKKDER